MMPKELYFSRVRKEFRKKKLDAVLISSHANIVYLTNFSSFSKDEREAHLLLVAKTGYILTDGRYSEAVRRDVKDFELIEISPKASLEKALKKLIKKHKIKRLGIEENNLTISEHKKITKLLNNLPAGKAGLNHFNIEKVKAIKTSYEIEAIEKACKLGDNAFKFILKKIKPGVSEKELAFEIEFFIKKHGGDLSFPPIVAFGANSSVPHHKTSDQRLASSDQFILLDFGVKLNNYCSDMTRTVFVGPPTKEQKRMYQTVLEAQELTINYLYKEYPCKANESEATRSILGRNVDKVARDYIVSKNYKTIPHSLGHGIGLEVHEAPHLSPKSKDILKEGMVFSIEPGIYIPGFGGVRIEDLVVLENSGPRLLTHSPRTIIEL